jgi:hypothetical protein
MNTNIVSIQTIVNVQQSGDYITGIVEVKKDGKVIGYTITFGKHEPITIYNGEDGSATAPIIGVAKDTDGVYYWTLNGEWLLDDNGNKLPVSGKDGQNGANGSMPQLKIEEGYWYVSYDNGATWTQLGKATGEDGQNGDKGDKGDTGDSMFQSVTQDENYVYFTLADGTVIKITKKNPNTDLSNGFYKNREYVDLGLPSGTKWAKENLNGIYCFGGVHSNILTNDTIYINGKPIEVGDSICGTQYDVATIEWGEGWQLPTVNDFKELLDYCIVSYLSEDCMRFKSKINGKTIHFEFNITPEKDLLTRVGTYTWEASYLTGTAYQKFWIKMTRYYTIQNQPGYDENSYKNISTANSNEFYLVRPVYKH